MDKAINSEFSLIYRYFLMKRDENGTFYWLFRSLTLIPIALLGFRIIV